MNINQKARLCAEWMNYCLSIGWPKRDLDGLQRVFYRCRGWETFRGYRPLPVEAR